MKKALFDSNILIYLSQGRLDFDILVENYAELCISVISYMEVLGFRFRNENEKNKVRELLSLFDRIELTEDIIEKTIDLRANNAIKLPDAIILATAIVHNCELVTNNEKDFKNLVEINGLNLD